MRYRIYRTEKAHDFLCVIDAKSRTAAMKTARRMFVIPRDGYAIEETVRHRLQTVAIFEQFTDPEGFIGRVRKQAEAARRYLEDAGPEKSDFRLRP